MRSTFKNKLYTFLSDRYGMVVKTGLDHISAIGDKCTTFYFMRYELAKEANW